MKYFIDTEFIEGFHKPLFGKRRHFIDLISIGVVCEDGRSYYAISNEFNPKDASDWVKENVISQLAPKNTFTHRNIDGGSLLWKSNAQIAKDIIKFCFPQLVPIQEDIVEVTGKLPDTFSPTKFPEFYGYYSDYDWVLLCSLFGTMMELPKGFPMYCIDLKQTLDEKASKFISPLLINHNLDHALTYVKGMENYPTQKNEHNALADAKWNQELYKFLQTI